MEASEKARELLDKYCKEIPTHEVVTSMEMTVIKNCALIAVNEIINYCTELEDIKHWQEVKEEVLKYGKESLEKQNGIVSEWQVCPKCNGQGLVSKPPYVAGDVNEWVSASISHVCDVCNGAKVLVKPIVKNEDYR